MATASSASASFSLAFLGATTRATLHGWEREGEEEEGKNGRKEREEGTF